MNENQPTYRVKNPTITLYAFHLHTDLGGTQEPEDRERLWKNIEKLSGVLDIPELKGLRKKLDHPPDENIGHGIPLPLLEKPLAFSSGGYLWPQSIHDTYAADLTLGKKGEIEVSELGEFNPDGALLPRNIEASLGQTLMLYAEKSDESDPREIADECVKALFRHSDEAPPELTNEGRFLGSSLFEYEDEDDTYPPLKRRHILIWLDESPETLRLFEKCSNVFEKLLCCRNKILFSFHQSRGAYANARQVYMKLEEHLDEFDFSHKTKEERRKHMESLLEEMPFRLLEYARHIRNLSDHHTAIRTNMKNYETHLEEIRQHCQPEDDAAFLEDFAKKDCRRFLEQSRTDRDFLTPGQNLFQQVISGIRGLTEIDTLRQLKENEERGSKRQERLEKLVAFVFAVLEGATLAAALNPRLSEEILGVTHPLGVILFYTVFVGFPAGLIALLLVWLFQNMRKKE